MTRGQTLPIEMRLSYYNLMELIPDHHPHPTTNDIKVQTGNRFATSLGCCTAVLGKNQFQPSPQNPPVTLLLMTGPAANPDGTTNPDRTPSMGTSGPLLLEELPKLAGVACSECP